MGTEERHDGRGRERRTPLVVGRIGAAHGIRGEVAVDVRTDAPEARFAPGAVLATEPAAGGPLTVSRCRWHGSRLLVRFAEVSGRSAAEALRDTFLVVDATELPPTEAPDEFHDHELIDLAVVSTAGDDVGTVADVFHAPGQDLLAIRLRAGGEALVPFVAAIVPVVDPASGTLVIDPPPGLIDSDASE